MTRLEQATKRLERAVERLERAAAQAERPAGGPAAGQNAESDGQLKAELEKARKEQADLRAVTQDVSKRLDAVISRLKSAAET